MPGKEHRVLVEMFTQCPEMAVWLLELSGMRFPPYATVEVVDGRFTLVTAAGEKEMAADLVLVCRDVRGAALRGVIVEIQRGPDPGKVRSCHVYQAVFWAVLGCPVAVLMVCNRRERAKTFSEQFGAGVADQVPPPVVLDLDLIPVLDADGAMAAPPEWVLLELLSHGRSPDGPPVSVAACIAALARVNAKDPNRAVRYTEVILRSWLGARYKEEFMDMLEDEEFTLEAEFFTSRIHAAEQAAAHATEAGALLAVLVARGFTVTEALRQKINTCDDFDRLQRAVPLAATLDPGQPFSF